MKKHSFKKQMLPVFLPLLILIASGWQGIDYGNHWDEIPYQIRPVKKMTETGLLLPDLYMYPSFTYYLTLSTLALDFAREKATGVKGMKERVFNGIEKPSFLLRLRKIFLMLSAATIVGVYALILIWRRSVPEALLGASLIAFSWEVAYHSRFVATDSLVMLFSSLTLMCCTFFLLKPSRQRDWLYPAAVFAGLATGTKYPAALLLICVWWCLFSKPEKRTLRQLIQRAVLLSSITVGTYLITTPGTLLQPETFKFWVTYIRDHYKYGPHWGSTIEAGWPHFARMVSYLAFTLFSPFPVAAFFVFLSMGVGAYYIYREDKRLAALFTVFPALYVIYLSTNRVMIVRNLLILIPFLAVLAARGLHEGLNWIPKKPRPWASGIFLFSLLVPNATWLFYTAHTISKRPHFPYREETARYVEKHKRETLYLSPRVKDLLAASPLLADVRTVDDPEMAERVVAWQSEYAHREDWPNNRFHQFATWIGPYEVNLDYYSSWAGDDRIVVLTHSQWLQAGMRFSPSETRALTSTAKTE